jgi:hypothetical protein
MRSLGNLPENYEKYYSLDLQNDKKMMLRVNTIALIIATLLVVPMLFIVPISHLFDMSQGLGLYALRFGVMLAALVVYMVLHELTHGVAMKICGTKRVKYGFTGIYAFAGSDDYYGKGAYIFIALAPVVLLGAIIAVINALVPLEWFWVVYFVQISNLSGAAGDFFVTVKFLRFPKDILVRDAGTSMIVYSTSK